MSRAHDIIRKIGREKKVDFGVVTEVLDLIATGEADASQARALAMGLRMASWEGIALAPAKEPQS